MGWLSTVPIDPFFGSDSFRDAVEGTSNSKAIIGGQLGELGLQGIDELSSVAREMVRLIETATIPIFAVDSDGKINGWNAKVAEQTGLSVDEAMGKSLVQDLVFGESRDVVEKLLSRALRGIVLLRLLSLCFKKENLVAPQSQPFDSPNICFG
ncbi:phytochrome B-like [Asparagus officinalis]|uniref:phytochrome B-like n=1 Tax=Asparagus officinalis TaxID=4686 RepID=UPI00098E1FBF|nr:phytochrome B-like [Asparagus officinalis]